MSPALAGRFFTTSATWEAPLHLWATYKGMCGNGIHGKYTGITLPLLFVVHSLSHVRLSATPWIAAPQDIYPSLPPRVCSHSCPLSWCCYLILCRSLLLSHSVFPSIRVFTSESVLHIRWPNIGASASASVLPVNIQSWFPLGINWFDLLEVQGLSQFGSNISFSESFLDSSQLKPFSFFIIPQHLDCEVVQDKDCHIFHHVLVPK